VLVVAVFGLDSSNVSANLRNRAHSYEVEHVSPVAENSDLDLDRDMSGLGLHHFGGFSLDR
jgi:hypothetical protein